MQIKERINIRDSAEGDGFENRPTVFSEPTYGPPIFGIKIGWNQPENWWRPFIQVDVWRYQVKVGWLWKKD